ncbi:MAG: hypothetical protein J1G02_01235 [Clostridiales bacterium]|nr:hypothetical protein [Clostridiales bacterium]
MLDKKTDAVLELLTEKVGNSYKVLNKNQLLDQLPKKLGIDMQGLLGIITFLKENEYVDVKYQDKEEICLSTTVKAESYVEGEKNITQKAKITNGQVGLLMLGVFAAAFLGALIATLIGKLF